MLLNRAFSEPCAPLKESQAIYFASSASPGIVYIRMISNDVYGTLGQSQDYELLFSLLNLFSKKEKKISINFSTTIQALN